MVQGFVTYTPTIVTNLFILNKYAAPIPSTVCSPISGDMPKKTPIAKESAIFFGESLVLITSLSLSRNAKVLVSFRFQDSFTARAVNGNPLFFCDLAYAKRMNCVDRFRGFGRNSE